MLPSLDTTYPVLILKMSPSPVHHGALAVARTLGRCGVPVYAVVEDAYTPLGMTRYLTKAFVWDPCPADPESFLKAMSAIADFIARPTVVIPMDDLSAVLVAENADRLAPRFLLPHVPPHLPHQLANKACFHALCAAIGIPSVRTVAPQSLDDVRAFIEGLEFPVMVKAAEQWLPLKDAFSTKVIQTAEELLKFCGSHNFAGSQGLVIQEYIPGEDWICHGYYDSKKNVSVTFTGKKLRSYPAGAGSTAVGLSLENEPLRCTSEKLLKAVAFSGIIDMDWRKDERDGQYKILDCNPRVGQNFRMFENRAGIDVVRAQHLHLSGRCIENSALIENRLFTVESFYVLGLLRRQVRGASKQDADPDLPPQSQELAWWSNDDPVPFLVMCVRLFLRSLKRALGHCLESPVFLHAQLSRVLSPQAK